MPDEKCYPCPCTTCYPCVCARHSPIDAEGERRQQLADARTTPETCGNKPGTNRRRKPLRQPGDRYTTISYHQAIRRACEEAFPPPAELSRRRVPARGRKSMKDATRWETEAEWRRRLGEKGIAALKEWRDAHHWHPHQLRHNAGTLLRKNFGVEAAQVILGHATLSVTEIYAEKNVAQAMKIMAEVG
jgi:integrase